MGSIFARLRFGSLALAVLPVLIAVALIALLSYRSATASLEERANEQLRAVQTVKAGEIQSYFSGLENSLRVIASTPTVQNAFVELQTAFPQMGSTLAVPIDEQREAVRQYFGEQFTAEYRRRNPGKDIDMSAIVDALPASALSAQYLYITENENPLGQKGNMVTQPLDQSAYAPLHATLQQYFDRVYKEFGFYDVFLVNAEDGTIMYTYFKEADFGTSLLDGPYAGSNLADAYLAARDADDAAFLTLQDFLPYLPSYDDQAAFFALPVFVDGKRVGILAAQAPIDRINAIMTFDKQWSKVGLGQTGEVFLVGQDFKARSQLRGMAEAPAQFLAALDDLKLPKRVIDEVRARGLAIGLFDVNTPGAKAVVEGKSASATYSNLFGREVLASYAPVDILGLKLGAVAEIDKSEALAPANELLRTILVAALITAAVVALIGFLVARSLSNSINNPIKQIADAVRKITAGDLGARVRLETRDELGDLGRAFDNLLDERVSTLALAASENEQLNNSVIEIMQSLGQLAQKDLTVRVPVTSDITGAVSDAINLVASETSKTLQQVSMLSLSVARASTQVRKRAEDVSEAAERSGVEVAAASQELAQAASALNAIAEQAQQANDDAERAISATTSALNTVSETIAGITGSRDQIRETEKRVKRLAERSQEINAVVSIINQIAERTSVLALNAGMQAAAAGEAGRGFAVVADEVKRLAENARDATNQITTLVTGIQADASDTIRTMNETISGVVDITNLAERAGEEMTSTLAATDGLVTSVRQIALTTEEQARASGVLMNRAQQIEIVTKKTILEVGLQQQDTATLLQYARALLDAVRVFKLPEQARDESRDRG